MKCDNCGRQCTTLTSEEHTTTQFQFAWPPIKRVIKQEMWCPACRYAPINGRESPSKRRKLEFSDDHPHNPDNE